MASTFMYRQPEDGDVCAMSSIQGFLPLYLSNLNRNLEVILNSKDLIAIQQRFDKPTVGICIGAGPSVQANDFAQLKYLKDFDGLIFCCDHILKDVLAHGIIPDAVVTVDAQQIVSTWFESDIIKAHKDDLIALISIMSHPDTIKNIPFEKYFFQAAMNDDILPNVSATIAEILKCTTINPYYNVGATQWNIMAAMVHCNPIGLIGYDYSYEPTVDIWRTQKIPVFVSERGGTYENRDGGVYITFPDCKTGDARYNSYLRDIEKEFTRGYNKKYDNYYITDSPYETMAKTFFEVIDSMYALTKIQTINCTGAGRLHEMPQMTLTAFLQQFQEPLPIEEPEAIPIEGI